jgi:predicted nucleic acid-binding protein
MTYLLDTNVVSELRRRDRTDANVRGWADGVAASSLFLSAITILELESGVLAAERRDAAQGTILRNWFDGRVLPAFADRILPVDAPVALCCARLNVPDPRPYRDALIAATAIVHRMTVVTRNVPDFAPLGVRMLNPWEAT